MIRPIIIATLLALCATAAFAQEAAPDHTLECHDNGLHYVIGIPAADGGTSYRVGDFTGPDQTNPCSMDAPFTREFIAEDGNQLYFQAISDDLLVLAESTGPQYFLEVYNLEPSGPILKADAQDVEISEFGIHYYAPAGPATPQTCPRYDELTAGGMGAIIGEERFYAFTTASVEPGKGTRCYQTP
ncbi:MAG: hypothetical protein JWP26_2564 [Devosia sp.]|uniref:hypothetical protein n=1 Tax=Devosia sp. TaxID=1871048 RepID=UPI0026182042|nr:hypothetical protein [Devosia sp.]MDB5587594.1 hypothetical protein [Devosia sp.]